MSELVGDSSAGSVDRERDPRFRTGDRVVIVDGLRVWDYDLMPGTVWFGGRKPSGVYWDGWFEILRDDGSMEDHERRAAADHAPVPTVVDDLSAALLTAVDAAPC